MRAQDDDDARTYLAQRAATLTTDDFHHSVFLATIDCVLSFFNCAVGEHRGEYYFIWTQQHGHFVEHRDDVAKFWVCDHQRPNTRTVHRNVHERDITETTTRTRRKL